MDGRANVEKFQDWLSEVKDFKPYVYQGTLSVSLVARECGLKREVFYTNPTLKEHLWPQLLMQLEKAGILKARSAQPAQLVVRKQVRSPASDARTKQIQEENEALKAENQELRRQLERFKGLTDSLYTTGRLPW